MPGSFTTHAPFPPARTPIATPHNATSGTITQISTASGPCICQIYSAAGVLLTSIDSTKAPASNPANTQPPGNPAYSISTSIAFSGGVPTCVQQSSSDITFTFA
jgi:hypothetical protein